MADVYVSFVELRIAPATVVRSASASQSVSAFTQTATAQRVTSAITEISFVALQLPGTAAAALNISASQTVGAFGQAAAMSDLLAQINGGGAITDEKPHRSIGGTQSVGSFPQSAAGGGAGVLGPILATAVQTVDAFQQVARADAQRVITAAQTVDSFGQSAYIGDRPQPATQPTSGAPSQSDGRRYKTRVKGRTIYADSYDSLRRKVLALDADAPPKQQAPKIARATVVEAKVDPVAQVRTEMQTQMATLQRQMAELMQQRVQDAQRIAKAYEARIANAETGTKAALALAQKAQNDMHALSALLTE